jgi:hypothetical protein
MSHDHDQRAHLKLLAGAAAAVATVRGAAA